MITRFHLNIAFPASMLGVVLFVLVACTNSPEGRIVHGLGGSAYGSPNEPRRLDEHETLELRVKDCQALRTLIGRIGHQLRSVVTSEGLQWEVRYQPAELIHCNEKAVDNSIDRLKYLREHWSYIVSVHENTAALDEEDRLLFAEVSEENFLKIQGKDTVYAVFVHQEGVGKGPWGKKYLVTFPTSGAEGAVPHGDVIVRARSRNGQEMPIVFRLSEQTIREYHDAVEGFLPIND